jgi:uncharacterized protein YdeI (YjbR/CyaY-like superfamily)
VNIAKVELLTAQGRMYAAGLEAFARRTAVKSRIYAYEQADPPFLTPQEIKQFKANKAAWKFFEAAAPSYRKVITHWVVSAKQAATRARRLEQLIAASSTGQRLAR